jgi:hypothetical protein
MGITKCPCWNLALNCGGKFAQRLRGEEGMNQVGKWKAPPAPEANIFRIFISTDNHLGYAEKNDYPPRQDDSFRAVEEVLENATAAQASTAVSYARAP